jgi:hypothetical protein
MHHGSLFWLCVLNSAPTSGNSTKEEPFCRISDDRAKSVIQLPKSIGRNGLESFVYWSVVSRGYNIDWCKISGPKVEN